jgi:tRNA(fMet)-specific endonuclease VapC
MTRYLLDTNILSALMRDPRGRVLDKIEAVGRAKIYTSVIVAAELRFGAAKRKSAGLAKEVEAFLGRLPVSPIEPPLDRVYADVRSDLEGRGEVIGANDLLIACQAYRDGSVVVTDNVREFSRVKGLKVENWLRE